MKFKLLLIISGGLLVGCAGSTPHQHAANHGPVFQCEKLERATNRKACWTAKRKQASVHVHRRGGRYFYHSH